MADGYNYNRSRPPSTFRSGFPIRGGRGQSGGGRLMRRSVSANPLQRELRFQDDNAPRGGGGRGGYNHRGFQHNGREFQDGGGGRGRRNYDDQDRRRDDNTGRGGSYNHRGFQHNGGRGKRNYNGQDRRRHDGDVIFPIGYKMLESMLEEQVGPHQIAQRLSTERSGFEVRLQQTDLGSGMIQMLLKVVGKMCSGVEPSQSLNQVLQILLNTDFHLKVLSFVNGLLQERRGNMQEKASGYISNCLHLMTSWLVNAQNSSENAVSVLLLIVKNVAETLNLGLLENIKERIEEVDKLMKELDQVRSRRNHYERLDGADAAAYLDQMHEEDPPDDFRSISVFPTINDINPVEDPFVRTNIVNKAYRSVDHYLDVQFRLLREDFIRPLREGIKESFNTDFKKKLSRTQGVKIYHDVKIEYPTRSMKGITYRIHFNVERLKFVNWQNSKRLLYGNLVCLSSDEFKKHLLFASVVERKVEDLSLGLITLEFISVAEDRDVDDAEDVQPVRNMVSSEDLKKKYFMVESEAYFEAYRHVLAGLQETRAIPLEPYLIRCDNNIRPPQYIRVRQGRGVSYDFSSILKKTTERRRLNNRYDLLNVAQWPSEEDVGLDKSQLSALKSALTNELSVIQGPPGTGKTHVGLIIAKMLLKNQAQRRREPPRAEDDLNLGLNRLHLNDDGGAIPVGPILVVCYTNHALDQFLEGISQFQPNGLIRVGGRCKTESLKQYSLYEVSRNSSKFRQDRFDRKTVYDLRCDMDACTTAMKKDEDLMKDSTEIILPVYQLVQVVPKHLINQLRSSNDDDQMLMTWLELTTTSAVQPLPVPAAPAQSYIIQETVQVITYHLAQFGFDIELVRGIIMQTGELDVERLITLLLEPPPQMDVDLPMDEIVREFLDKRPVPLGCEKLLQDGYHELELKCASLATDLAGNHSPQEIEKWLRDKQAAPQQDDDEDGFRIEGEADFLQDQRMFEEDADDFGQRNNGRNIRHRNHGKVSAAASHQLKIDDGGGWELAGNKNSLKQKVRKEIRKQLNKVDVMSSRRAMTVNNIFTLRSEERWRLYRRWISDLRQQLSSNLNRYFVKYDRLAKDLASIRRREHSSVLESANVIAMTTTGAAKYRDMISRLPVKIVIVEEAAEVLEAHIVTSMPRTTEHLILIGDHQQLKPSPTVYELAKRFNLDVSLFERMIKNGVERSKLTLQHRMRPRIADLLRPHIYDDLEDHESVLEYEDVIGVQKNIFFLSHEQKEKDVKDGMSKVNQYEADFMVALCKYLLQQGYMPHQITILTAYVGQLFAFKKTISNKLHRGVRVTAVDNFQGEENDIILLSLVRSNEEGKIGFLGVENRICVALSRAKKGLFCIGNFKMLKKKSEMWSTILRKLKSDDLTGEALPLQCKNHKDKIVLANQVKDFEKMPEGGCGQPCQYRLKCGHVCTRSCHPDDEDHELFRCRKPCGKYCEAGHRCTKKCHEICRCLIKIPKVIPGCGHIQNVPCYKDVSEFKCEYPCSRIKPCGHKCDKQCGYPCSSLCMEKIEVKGTCGHQTFVHCYESTNQNRRKCGAKCKEILRCNHPCKGTCGSCTQNRLHVRCGQKCERILVCGHVCVENCSTNCPPCGKRCETACAHSKCPKSCMEPCMTCSEKCEWKCRHYQCGKLCSEPCDRPPCNLPCRKSLKCGHRCIGLCGEPCPKLCRVCNKDKVEEIFFGDEDEPDAKFVELIDCGHIFTNENLDTWMNQASMDDSNSTLDIKLKECPRCKTPIRRSTRYGCVVNTQLKLINDVKRKIAGNPQEVENTKKQLKAAIDLDLHIRNYFPKELVKLHKMAKSSKSLMMLNAVEVQFTNLAELSEVEYELTKLPYITDTDSYKSALKDQMENLVNWLFKDRSYFSEQETSDLGFEMERSKLSLQFLQIQNQLSTPGVVINDVGRVRLYLQKMEKIIFYEESPLDDDKAEMMKKVLKYIKELWPKLAPGLGITDQERQMIVQAVGLSRGHWYKCRNGHVYCIGECGGATVEGKCPECKETIGGSSHRLHDDNQVAGEMDGATRSAWDPNTFHIPDNVQRWMQGL